MHYLASTFQHAHASEVEYDAATIAAKIGPLVGISYNHRSITDFAVVTDFAVIISKLPGGLQCGAAAPMCTSTTMSRTTPVLCIKWQGCSCKPYPARAAHVMCMRLVLLSARCALCAWPFLCVFSWHRSTVWVVCLYHVFSASGQCYKQPQSQLGVPHRGAFRLHYCVTVRRCTASW